MPEILHRCVDEVMAKGHDESSAWAICRTSLNMCEGKAKEKGKMFDANKNKSDMDEMMKTAYSMCEDMKKGNKQFDIGQTFNIPGVEIFGAGTWNGDSYTPEDLDEMVNAFNETQNKYQPFLKLGHDKNQKLLQKDGYPAAGYISRLYRVGSKLIADFTNIPKAIYELIKVGAYKKRSAEIFVNFPFMGKTYKYLLKAVAFLGADTPAVQSLKDILNLYAYASDNGSAAYDTDAPSKEYEMDADPQGGDNIMNEEIKKLTDQLVEANKKLSESDAKIKELEIEQTKVKELTEKLDAKEKQYSEIEKLNTELKNSIKVFEDEKNKSEINVVLDKWINDKKIVPAQREAAFTILMEAKVLSKTEKKYKVGDKESTYEELLHNFIQMGDGAGLPTEPKSKQTPPHGTNQGAMDEADKIHAKVLEYQEKNKVSYREALAAVSPEGLPRTGEEIKEEE